MIAYSIQNNFSVLENGIEYEDTHTEDNQNNLHEKEKESIDDNISTI
jgi:hypothetical protein